MNTCFICQERFDTYPDFFQHMEVHSVAMGEERKIVNQELLQAQAKLASINERGSLIVRSFYPDGEPETAKATKKGG